MPAHTVTREHLLDIYQRAYTIFQSDTLFRRLISSGTLPIVFYSVRGQEVVSAAMMAALESTDYLVTTYRGLHDQIAKGVPLKPLWAEFAGKATGTCRGKGGPMHITHPDSGVVVTTGIVGSGIPIASGLGLSSQLSGDGRVTVCCFGDGATNIGAFHEGVNMAALWKLPVVFLCQNNRYGEHTKFEYTSNTDTVAERGSAYAIRSTRVNGNDAEQMAIAAQDAVAHARAGKGPTLIEAMTFRFHGHVFGDPAKYIPEQELAAAMDADPVPLLRQRLIDEGMRDQDLTDLEQAIEAEVKQAAEFALESDVPDRDELNSDVFDEVTCA